MVFILDYHGMLLLITGHNVCLLRIHQVQVDL